MDLVSYALTDVTATRTYLGYKDTSKDELIKLLINVATDYIEDYCGRRFKNTVYTNEVISGNGEKEMLLPQYPITAFVLLEKNGAVNNSASWESVDGESYWRDDPVGKLFGTYRFECGVRNYRVTYSAGYATIPYDLQFACMKLVELMARDTNAQGLSSERLGDHAVTFSKASEDDPMLKKILDKYKKPNL